MMVSDDDLLSRAVRNAHWQVKVGEPRWVGVMAAFACGSGLAMMLCRRFELDPDEIVRKRQMRNPRALAVGPAGGG